MPLGKRIVIIGGGLVGIELAEFLAERNRKVTVLEEEAIFALQMAHPRRWRVLHDVRKAGVDLVPRARVDRITERAVDFSVSIGDEKVETRSIKADSVIVTLGLEPNPDLAARMDGSDARVISIGDCTGVGYIEGAIGEGFRAALAIDSPTIDSPAIDSPAIDSPAIDSPAIDSPAIDSPAIDSNEA
jgi:2,4-dienoyl-CoA reductase (NADPH2)